MSIENSTMYKYQEEKSYLCLSYDAANKAITLRGGRHGLTRLAEIFHIFSTITATDKSSYEDEHWNELCICEYGLKIYVDNRLPNIIRKKKPHQRRKSLYTNGEIYARVEVLNEPTEVWTLMEDGELDYERREATIQLMGNAKGFGSLLKSVINVLDTMTNLQKESKPQEIQGLDVHSARLFIEFDSLLDDYPHN